MDTLNQERKMLKMLRSNNGRGVPNYRFPQAGILSYTKVISNLRKDGHAISTERVYSNGRWTGTYLYRLTDETSNKLIDRLRRLRSADVKKT